MGIKKKIRDQRALDETTMILFLKIIASTKRKLSASVFVDKIQMKYPAIRPSRIQSTIHHLKKDSYIRLERNIYPRITEKGAVYLDSVAQKQKTHWDKRFRIILFDSIKTTTHNRVYIRAKIKKYGFIQLVRGAWVYPYVCDAFITLLNLEYELGGTLMCLTTQDTPSMAPVRKHFRLR